MKPSEYIGSDRRGREAHDLELEAMHDPFLADALEGMENTEGDHAAAVGELRQRIASRAAAAGEQRPRIGSHAAAGKAARTTGTHTKAWRITAAAAAILAVMTAGLLTLRHIPDPEPPRDPGNVAQNRPSLLPADTLPADTNPKDSAASAGIPDTQAARTQTPEGTGKKTPAGTKTRNRKGTDSGMEANTTGKATPATDAGKEPETGLGRKTDIDQVIVVGYGRQDKKSFTGSADAAAGTAPELSSPIRIRGSIDPKRDTTRVHYVVDGKTYDDITWLAADDIASVGVEKEHNRIVIQTKEAEALVQVVTPVVEEFPPRHPDITEKDGPLTPDGTPDEEESFFLTAEAMPSFQGGDLSDFRKWVQERVRKPETASENGIQGRVFVSFVIDTLGRLTDIEVLRSPDQALSDETVRVIKSSPRWEPGRLGDRKVRIRYTLPVDFGSRQE